MQRRVIEQALSYLFLIISFIFCNHSQASLVKEYGIVIIPDDICSTIGENLNNIIATELPQLQNYANIEHITLFQGAFSDSRINEIYNLLKVRADLSPLIFYIDKIDSVSQRKIYLKLKKNKQLFNLHKRIVKNVSPFKLRTLERVHDDYDNLEPLEQKMVEKYGTNNVFEKYNPHMTIFYQYSIDYNLETIAKKLSSDLIPTRCDAAKLAIVELGYNGNVVNILHSLNFKQK